MKIIKRNILIFFISILFLSCCDSKRIDPIIVNKFNNKDLEISITFTSQDRDGNILLGVMEARNNSKKEINFFPLGSLYLKNKESYIQIYIDSIASIGVALGSGEIKKYQIYISNFKNKKSLNKYSVFLKTHSNNKTKGSYEN